MGLILRYLTPLTIGPAVAMLGISLFKVASENASSNWGIAALTIGLIILFSQYLKNVQIPLPSTNSKIVNSEKSKEGLPVFQVFPVLLTIFIAWGICGILTATDSFSSDNPAKVNFNMIDKAPWFYIPYPFQWGWPTISVGAVLGMLSGVIASAVESIGDYYACARISGAKPPPRHALNRGIFIEGVGCVLAGIFGTGNGTTSYSENIGAISVTKVGSRRVIQAAGVLMIIFSLVGKFGAVFVSIPVPIIGGIFSVVFATVTAVGLSNLQSVDLNSSRNIFVLGFSIFFGLSLSQWVEDNPGVIQVGVDSLDQIINILLSTGMFVTGFIGFVLDNTIPGTPEERGLVAWSANVNQGNTHGEINSEKSSYNLPFGMGFIQRTNWLKYLPISPTFDGKVSS